MAKTGQAPAKNREYVTQVTIEIENGYPNPEDVYVRHGAVVRFTNEDPQDYVIRLFSQGDEIRPGLDLFLPAYGSRTLVAGLDLPPNETRDCDYDVIEAQPVPEGVIVVNRKERKTETKDAKAGGGSGGSGTVHVGGN